MTISLRHLASNLLLVLSLLAHPQIGAGSLIALASIGSRGYTVQGRTIIGPNGRAFVPFGITVYGLSYFNWQTASSQDLDEIRAAATTWHSNTIRIQVDPRAYMASVDETPVGDPIPSSGMQRQLSREVTLAQQLGLVVIISAQTENDPSFARTLMPGPLVARVWQRIGSQYRHDSAVWFELFNEPRISSSGPRSWRIWRDGGHGYVGMQTILSGLRSAGTDNIVVADGLDYATVLQGVPALSGINVLYGVHPYFSRRTQPSDWPKLWGQVALRLPVIADEWSEYASGAPECNSDAPRLVPAFLSYLYSLRVGLIVWTLRIPGVLITQQDRFDTPTRFNPNTTYVCSGFPTSQPPQGAGSAILAFFEKYSVKG